MVKRIIEIEKLVKNEEARESRISPPASRERERVGVRVNFSLGALFV